MEFLQSNIRHRKYEKSIIVIIIIISFVKDKIKIKTYNSKIWSHMDAGEKDKLIKKIKI